MLFFAHIVSFGNFLALLVYVACLMMVYPMSSVGPLGAGLISALSLYVFISQRSYARFIVHHRPELTADQSAFTPLFGRLDIRLVPRLMIAVNLLFIAVAALLPYFYRQDYDRFIIALNGHLSLQMYGYFPHPLCYWLIGGFAFQLLIILTNILFNLACILDRWPRQTGVASPLRIFVRALGGMLLLPLLLVGYSYVSSLYRAVTWPQFETATLYDGQDVELAPPPGYIRIEPDHPALQKFISSQVSNVYNRDSSLVAIFAADKRSYKKIIKNLENGCYDYNCLSGLAWVQQTHSDRRYTMDPAIPLAVALWWPSGSGLVNRQYKIISPAFYLDTTGHVSQYYGSDVVHSGLIVNGKVVVSERLLTVKSYYGQKGGMAETQRRRLMDVNRQWLEAVSGWSPPLDLGQESELAEGIHPRFLESFTQDLLETWYAGKFPKVTALAYNGRSVLLVGRETGDIEVWDMQRENAVRFIPRAHRQRVTSLSFSPDGNTFFSSSAGRDGVKVWNGQTGGLLHSITDLRDSDLRHMTPGSLGPAIAVDDDALYLVTDISEILFFDSRTKILYPQTRPEQETIEKYRGLPGDPGKDPPAVRPNRRLSEAVYSMAVDRERGLVAVGTNSGSIHLYQYNFTDEIPGLELVNSFKPDRDGSKALALNFSTEEGTLYSVDRTGKIDEWSVPGLLKIKSIPLDWSNVTAAEFLPESDLLALAGNASPKGERTTKYRIALINLSSGHSIIRPAITDSAQLEFIPALNQLIAVHGCVVTAIDY